MVQIAQVVGGSTGSTGGAGNTAPVAQGESISKVRFNLSRNI